jgi:hypothetical protein
MKVKVLKKEWTIKDISYKQRRELYELNVKAFWQGEVDPENYYTVLNKTSELAGLEDKELDKLSMPEVDQLLQAILTSYLGLEKKVDGA